MSDTANTPTTTPTADTLSRRGIRSYVKRTGRITIAQQRALTDLWPRYGLELDQGPIDPVQIFGRQASLTLEIGFGMGHSLLQMARSCPDQDFIGIEVHEPGVGSLLTALEEQAISNVRLYRCDALEVLQHCIPDTSLHRLLLFFPDPWHKARHHKRRIVQPAFVQRVHNKLQPSGILHMATDWHPYAEHMLDVLTATPGFSNLAGARGWYTERPSERPETKFERRGQRLGHGVWDLKFQRTA